MVRKLFISKEELNRLYWDRGLSAPKISKIFNVSSTAILYWAKKYKIHIRSPIERKGRFHPRYNKPLISKKKLEKLYKEMPSTEIAKYFNKTSPTIRYWLKKYRIHVRTSAEMKGKFHSRYGKHLSEEHKRKLREIGKQRLYPKEFGEKISNTLKERIKEGKFNPFKNHNIKPTKLEKKFISIIEKYGLPYKYVGDWAFVLGGKCPDFLNTNGEKKVIELFGQAFHSPLFSFRKVPYHQTAQGAKEHYNKYGFSCLVLWENELNNEERVIKKINSLA